MIDEIIFADPIALAQADLHQNLEEAILPQAMPELTVEGKVVPKLKEFFLHQNYKILIAIKLTSRANETQNLRF